MIDGLPKTSERIFPTNYRNIQSTYVKLRKRVADNIQNPRILSISFISYRHWGGTQLAWVTNGNVLVVKEKLGHKKIENTMKYTQLVSFSDTEYEVTTAQSLEEAKQVLSAGFDYVAEKDGIMLFRKPKRYMNA